MTVKKLLFLLSSLLLTQFSSIHALLAQNASPIDNDIFSNLQNDTEDQGKVVVYQDVSAQVIIDRHKRMNKGNITGYRIQIYRGSGQSARDEVREATQTFLESFPDADPNLLYAIYEAPYFKLRFGDFRTKNEAFEFLYEVKKVYHNAYIVNSAIKYPKLVESQEEQSDNE